jgi:hypothetical protein
MNYFWSPNEVHRVRLTTLVPQTPYAGACPTSPYCLGATQFTPLMQALLKAMWLHVCSRAGSPHRHPEATSADFIHSHLIHIQKQYMFNLQKTFPPAGLVDTTGRGLVHSENPQPLMLTKT